MWDVRRMRVGSAAAVWQSFAFLSYLLASLPCFASCLPVSDTDLQALDAVTEQRPSSIVAEVTHRLAAPGTPTQSLRAAQLYAILADALAEQSRIDEASSAASRGLQALTGTGSVTSSSARLTLRLNLLQAQLLIDKADEAGSVAAVSGLIAQILPSTQEYACALSVRAMAYHYLDQVDLSAADALEGFMLADANGWVGAREELAFTLAGLFTGAGLDDEAGKMLDIVTDTARTLHQTSLLSVAEYQRAELYIHGRRFPEALTALDRSIADATADDERFSVAASNVLRCWVLINLHQLAAAKAVCNAGDRELAEGEREDMSALLRSYRARLDLELQRPRDALEQLAPIVNSRLHKLLPRQETQIYSDRGLAYMALGRYREAAADLARAAEIESSRDKNTKNREVAMMSAVVVSEKLKASNEFLRQRMIHEQSDLFHQRQARRQWTAVAITAALSCAMLAYLLVMVRRHNRELRRHQAILRSTSKRAPDAFVLLDEDQVVRFASRNLFGDGPPHPVGQPLGAGVPKSQCHALNAAIGQSFSSREIATFGAEIDTVSGRRQFDMYVLPAVDGDLLLGLTIRSIEVTKTRALEREVLDGAALERHRLSSELHEGLGQQLAGVLLMLGNLATVIKRGLPGAADLAEEIGRYVAESIESTQKLARGLAPVQIGSGSLSAALDSLVQDAGERLHVQVSCEFRLNDVSLSNLAADHFYRICREAITNGALHGRCSRVDLEFARVEDNVVITICDDGSGLKSVTSAQEGFGIKMMLYRAQTMGGSMTLSSAPQGGTCVVVQVPVAKVAA